MLILKHSGKGTCGDNMSMCSSKSCIPQRYKCDGTPDCGDGADESREICGKYFHFFIVWKRLLKQLRKPLFFPG
jgi:hypothetical protein